MKKDRDEWKFMKIVALRFWLKCRSTSCLSLSFFFLFLLYLIRLLYALRGISTSCCVQILHAPSSVVSHFTVQPYCSAAFGLKSICPSAPKAVSSHRMRKKMRGAKSGKWKVESGRAGAGIFDFLDRKKLWFNHHLQSLRESLSSTQTHIHTMSSSNNSIKLLTGNSHPELAQQVADR